MELPNINDLAIKTYTFDLREARCIRLKKLRNFIQPHWPIPGEICTRTMCKLETLACSYSGAVNQTNCAFYDRSMKLSVVFLYTLKFVFRRGATSELTSGTGQRPNQIWPPSPMMKIQLGVYAHVMPLLRLIGVWVKGDCQSHFAVLNTVALQYYITSNLPQFLATLFIINNAFC